MDLAKNVSSKVTSFLNQSMVQMCIVGGVLFVVLASPASFSFVNGLAQKGGRMVGIDVKLDGNMLVVIHALVFAAAFYVSINYILQPLLKK